MLTLLLCVVLGVLASAFASENAPWMDKSQTPAQRAALLLQAMELSEKVDMLHGWPTSEYVGFVPANNRLNIPALTLNDGPQGFRSNNHPGSSTSFPACT